MAIINPSHGPRQGWFREARRPRPKTSFNRMTHPADAWAASRDPFSQLVNLMRWRDFRHSVLLGATETGWNISGGRLNIGVLGQPRQGKTAGTAFTAAATHPGPLVWFGTKESEATGLGILRARIAGPGAELSYISLDGSPTPTGWTARGYTPISDNWLECFATSHSLAGAATGATNHAKFWQQSGASILAPILYAAGLGRKDMEWLSALASTQDEDLLYEAERILTHDGGRPGRWAANRLAWVKELAPETKSSVWATASTALMSYDTEESLSVTRLPLLDPEQFIRGNRKAKNPWLENPANDDPVFGCWPTLLVVAPVEEQELFAPLVCGMFSLLRRARYRLANADSKVGPDHRHPPLLAVFDDLPALAPDPKMPRTFAQSGGHDLICLATYHDDAQLGARWGKEGDNMATTLGEQVAYRGIGDQRTLERLSSRTGEQFVSLVSTQVSHSPARFGWAGHFTHEGAHATTSQTTSQQLMRRLNPAQIAHGHVAPDGTQNPNIIQTYHPLGWEWTWSLPYFSAEIWLRAIVASMEFFATLEPGPVHLLMPPNLEQEGPDHLLAAGHDGEETSLLERYRNAREALADRARRHWKRHQTNQPPPTNQSSSLTA